MRNGLSKEAADEAWKKPRDYWYSWLLPQTEGSAEASFDKVFEEIKRDHDFWVNAPPLDAYIPNQVQMYLTARECPNTWTKEWLKKNGFPDLPLVNTQVEKRSKDAIALEAGVHGHVDDKAETFIQCNRVLPYSFLVSRPWNIDVQTPRRIYKLEELEWRV
jgi:hypothetical protein